MVVLPGEGEQLQIGAASAEIKATAGTTGGHFSLSETTLPAGGPGPAPHQHEGMHDSFYVLDGTLTLHIGDELVDGPPGTFATIPPGVVHTFSNRSGGPVRFLNLNAPGGWEAYLRDLAAAMPAEGPPEPSAMAQIAAAHDVVFVTT